MTAPAALAVCLLLLALGVFQALLVCGVPLGRFAWGGQHRVLPPRLRVGSLITIVIYVLLGWVVLAGAGQRGGSHGIWAVAIWVIAGLPRCCGQPRFEEPPERLVMTPVALALCGLTVVVALQV